MRDDDFTRNDKFNSPGAQKQLNAKRNSNTGSMSSSKYRRSKIDDDGPESPQHEKPTRIDKTDISVAYHTQPVSKER